MLGLVSDVKKDRKMIKQNVDLFLQSGKQKQLLMKMMLIFYVNQFILWLYQTYRKLL